MTISVDELATKAMSLSGEARAPLAESLIENLDSIQAGIGIRLCQESRQNGAIKPDRSRIKGYRAKKHAILAQ